MALFWTELARSIFDKLKEIIYSKACIQFFFRVDV